MTADRTAPGQGAKILFLSYDGMSDQLGRSQVLPYLTGLRARGHRVTLISCEKPDRFRQHGDLVRRLCLEAGIEWHPLPYHKRPPILSSILDVIAMRRAAIRLHRRQRFDAIHCRSDMAGLVGLSLKRRRGIKFIYDMRAFWPDERVEGGVWNRSNPLYDAVYRYFKARESDFLNEAEHIVSLTHAGEQILLARPDRRANGPPITVIPCCADFDHFTPPSATERAARRAELGVAPDSKLVVYLGSIGTWYMLDEMLDFVRVYRERHASARMLFITQDDPAGILAAAKARGVAAEHLLIRPAAREEVPALVSAADFGLFFIKPVFSKKASSPTKLGEMLALGLPVVTNGGVGDVAAIVADVAAGVVIEQFDDATYGRAIDHLESLIVEPQQIRGNSLPWFDVQMGIDRYDAIYRRLAGAAESVQNEHVEKLSA